MVNIALGDTSVSKYPAGGKDGTTTVDEIVAAVNHAFYGCPASAGTSRPR